MKKRIFIVLGILIAAGGIGSGVWYHFNKSGQGGSADTVVYVSKVSVITGAETAATNRFAGVVEPQKTVNVNIDSGRKVKEVEVTVNPVDANNVIGHKKENVKNLKELYDVNLVLKQDPKMKQGKSKIEITETYTD